MKLLSFILSLALVQPSYGSSLLGEAGHGDTQDICSFPQSSAAVYKPQSVIDAEAKLKVATDKYAELESDLEREDCSYCEENFRKVISIVDKDNYDGYIRHLEGGSACSLAFNNVDIYNHWASVNKWEKIELYTRPKQAIRNIAGGCQAGDDCGEGSDDEFGNSGGGEVTRPEVTRPEVSTPDAPGQCLYYAGPNYSINSEACKVAKPQLTAGEYRKCTRCISKTDRRSYGKCLLARARTEEQLALLEVEIEELELDLQDAEEDAEYNNEEDVCANCPKDNRSTFAKWLLPGLGIAAGVGVGLLVKKAGQSAYDEQVAYNQVIQEDNNAKGYPTSPFDISNNSTRNGLIAGFAVGAPLFIAGGLKAGTFGCSASSLFGSGSVSSGSATGTQIGGATGISSILAGLLGGGDLSGGLSGLFGGGENTNGVTTGSAQIPPGYAMGADGQLIYVGNSAGLNGQPTVTTAELEADIRAREAQLANLNAYRTWEASRASVLTDTQEQLVAIGPNPLIGGNIYSQGTSTGVIAPSSTSLISGGISLNAGLQTGIGVLQPPGVPTTTVPISNGVNVAPPTTTQPTGIDRLINL